MRGVGGDSGGSRARGSAIVDRSPTGAQRPAQFVRTRHNCRCSGGFRSDGSLSTSCFAGVSSLRGCSARRTLCVALAALAVAGCGGRVDSLAGRVPPRRFEGLAIPKGSPAADFSLRDQNGRLVIPRSFNDAQQIADKFKETIPVILNLQSSDAELSKRLIDFASGLTYALDGGMQRVADKVFLLTPRNVEVSAEERARWLERGGFFNQA
jgi:hypothetical protein